MKIYFDSKDYDVELALELITDEKIEDGWYCGQTIMDLRDALKESLEEIKKLKNTNK